MIVAQSIDGRTTLLVFGQCIYETVRPEGSWLWVGVATRADDEIKLALSASSRESTTDVSWFRVPYSHDQPCPAAMLAKSTTSQPLPPCPMAPRPVSLAAALLIENSKGEILLTRRPATMRTFPLSWVVPGGSVEPGETLFSAALREAQEETGLDLRGIAGPIEVVAIWESSYPTRLEVGPPRRQHLVVYLRVRLGDGDVLPVPQCHTSLSLPSASQGRLQYRFQEAEVDLACWVTPAQLLVALDPDADPTQVPPVPLVYCSRVAESSDPNPTTDGAIQAKSLRGVRWSRASEPGALSEGTRYAIQAALTMHQ
ncbi:putative Nucleoside diphosphate-linked moiety X motif 17 [Paratrimastix pyriformis]|uniref:Nucleoside diphosphate-linked moiety X motif 17 n=1 Tax=Paratrimastix pyriformis TaxID=342808 RepID=A0ABQ8UPI0_9EUKA|nr:putative Nucleoside diphosphate-linked moiety X motif 17 [Paratrimastix pyriformis]